MAKQKKVIVGASIHPKIAETIKNWSDEQEISMSQLIENLLRRSIKQIEVEKSFGEVE